MRLTHERQSALQSRARHLGALAPRCTEVLGGYAGGVALYCRESIPLWDVVVGACGGFVIVLSYLLMQLRGGSTPATAGARDWSRALLDRVPGWRRLDDVLMAGCDVNHVVATPVGLLVVVTKWRVGARDEQARRLSHQADVGLAAAAARRVRRFTTLPPNALKVPVYAALLLWGPGNGAVRTGWDDAMGVYVLDANRPWAWPAELTVADQSAAELRPAQVDEALRKVSGWAAHHERRLELRRLARILLGEVRHGLRDRRSLMDRVTRGEDRMIARTLLAHSR
jgi:hypothetical protein